jgi:AcrR family transcriptional regulator
VSGNQTELDKRNVLRFSNEESNRLTRECIETAFISLLSEKEIDKITISEIAKKAGVSRSALYRNYVSKEEILECISNNFLAYTHNFAWRAITEKEPRTLYREIFEKIHEESQLFSLVIKAGVPDKNFIGIRNYVLHHYEDYDRRIRHILLGWAGMLLNIILNWYMEGMAEDIDTMADLCCSLSESIVQQIENIESDFLAQVSCKKGK